MKRYKILKYRRAISDVRTYEEYQWMASQLDSLTGADLWRYKKDTKVYSWQLIESRLENMKHLRETENIQSLVHCLRQDLMKGIGGISDPRLYNQSLVGTKKLVEDYHNEVIRSIQFIYYYKGEKITQKAKLRFFQETSQSYGHTALFLSGGASFGKFHFGTMKALYEQDLFPRIIVGSSVGALIGSVICSHKYQDLWKCFDPEYGIITIPLLIPTFSSL